MLAPYAAFARAAFQRQFAYRTANWAGLFTNVFFLFFRAAALAACFDARSQIGGLTVQDVVTYVTVSQSLVMVCPQWGVLGLAVSVHTGQVAMDLVRPVNLVGMYLSRRLAISGYYVIMRMLPLLAVGWLAGLLSFPPSPALWLPFASSVVLAAWIGICLIFLVEVSSFWFEGDRGVRYLVMGLAVLPSGLILPADFFPEAVQTVFALTPFPYTLYVPTEVWLGRLGGVSLLANLGAQLAWAVGLTIGCLVALSAGERRLQIMGG